MLVLQAVEENPPRVKRYLFKIRPWLLSKAEDLRYSKAYYYTRIFHKYDTLEAYLALYTKCATHASVKTTTGISFLKGVRSGATVKEVLCHLPVVRNEILSNGALHVKVIFYKMFIGPYRVKCHIHFFEDKMFLCSYTFSYLKEGEREKVMAILQKKYLPTIERFAGEVISDPDGNCIYVDAGLELTFNYLSLNDGLCTAMTNYRDELAREKVEKMSLGETEVFNSL
jgi:hypothetical protein